MYKLKDGMIEELKKDIEITRGYSGTINKFEHYFEKIELPKVELKSHLKVGKYSIHKYSTDNKNYDGMKIIRKGYVECVIGENYFIKSIQDFNEKCSQLFGFELIEAKEK